MVAEPLQESVAGPELGPIEAGVDEALDRLLAEELRGTLDPLNVEG